MAERRRLIAGNWKMYKTRTEALAFARALTEALAGERAGCGTGGATDGIAALDALICAPFTALFGLAQALEPCGVVAGAQNLHQATEGAFTGEISAAMLQDLGACAVVVGHSERRQYFAETDEAVAQKTVAALAAGLVPIVCVGESLEQRESGDTDAVVRRQMRAVLDAVSAWVQGGAPAGAVSLREMVVAYEPVWAIGTGRSSSAQDAQQVAGLIRRLLVGRLGETFGQAVRILYGGSVKPDNIAEFVAQADIDGALVGGASLQPASYAGLLRHAAPASKG